MLCRLIIMSIIALKCFTTRKIIKEKTSATFVFEVGKSLFSSSCRLLFLLLPPIKTFPLSSSFPHEAKTINSFHLSLWKSKAKVESLRRLLNKVRGEEIEFLIEGKLLVWTDRLIQCMKNMLKVNYKNYWTWNFGFCNQIIMKFSKGCHPH